MTQSFCTSCGSPLLEGSRFCTACGSVAPPGSQEGASPGGGRSWRVLAIVVLAAALIVGVVELTSRRGGVVATAATDPGDLATTTTTRTGSSTTTTITRSTTTTRKKSTTTSTAPASEVAGLDHWIAVLASIPTSLPIESIDAEVQRTRVGLDRQTFLVRSDLFGSMRPGYWVVYAASFGTSDQATAYCRSIGRPVPDQCYPKFLSY